MSHHHPQRTTQKVHHTYPFSLSFSRSPQFPEKPPNYHQTFFFYFRFPPSSLPPPSETIITNQTNTKNVTTLSRRYPPTTPLSIFSLLPISLPLLPSLRLPPSTLRTLDLPSLPPTSDLISRARASVSVPPVRLCLTTITSSGQPPPVRPPGSTRPPPRDQVRRIPTRPPPPVRRDGDGNDVADLCSLQAPAPSRRARTQPPLAPS
jgi:hypothetical protein